MCPLLKNLLHYSLLGVLVFFLSACDKISVPRLSFEDQPEPRIPITITYAFEPTLVNYTHTVGGCGLPYTIPVGEIIANTFLRIGQDRFNGVRAEPPVGDAQGVPPDGYRIIVGLKQFGFDPVDRIGQEDRYDVFVDLQLHIVYEDAKGTPLGQSPLAYYKTVRLWVPELSGNSTSCATGQLDGTVQDAAETLAKEMLSVVPRVIQLSQPGSPQSSQDGQPPATTPAPSSPMPPAPLQPDISPSVQFRTKLVDANQNLILEGGETIVLLIEVTNVSGSTIPSAYVELRGTPVLVEAFKRVAPLPVPIGELKAGEKRTTEIRGRLAQVKDKLMGELVIGIILSEGLPPGTHTIRTEIQPGPTPQKPTR